MKYDNYKDVPRFFSEVEQEMANFEFSIETPTNKGHIGRKPRRIIMQTGLGE